MRARPGQRQPASSSDLDRLYALLEERSAWLRSKNLAQWNPLYPKARFGRDLTAGHVWFWTAEDELIATVTLYPERPEYYPDGIWLDNAPAWYVCRLAVSPALAGRGVGSEILRQLESDAILKGLSALRLDVTASNPFLENYYAERAFVRVGVDDIKGGASIFMEKALNVSGAPMVER